MRRILLFEVLLLVALLLLAGCARRTPAARLAEEGGEVEVRLIMSDGETLNGRVVSLTRIDLVVDAVYTEGGGVSIDGMPDDRRVVVDGAEVEGRLLDVSRTSEGRVQATVRRTLPLHSIAEADFARSRRDVTLGTLISQIAGPAVGLLLGLLVQG
ncbi:MAG: hypothetical protein GF405_09775 [Candidatus Eisenbacteria bacterium]|nr:hypothetical protein [Candidatus Eisenbacteria bacterium]